MSSLLTRKAWVRQLLPLQKSIFTRHAVQNLTLTASIQARSMCMAWARDTIQDVFGKQFDEYFYKINALGSANAFINSPYARHPRSGSMPGDLLFFTKGHGPDGHVGIRVWGNALAENSILHWDGYDGRGVRILTPLILGDVDLIVRLPLVLSNDEELVSAWKNPKGKVSSTKASFSQRELDFS